MAWGHRLKERENEERQGVARRKENASRGFEIPILLPDVTRSEQEHGVSAVMPY